MKKLLVSLFVLVLFVCLVGCGSNEKTIIVGATPSPHAEILNSEAVKSYIESKGYKLEVKVYQDYVTPNKALNDGGIDANYFQHIPYLEEEISTKGYDLAVAAKIHNEPLNLYGKEKKTDWKDTKVYIINDASNVERAYKLLVANENQFKVYDKNLNLDDLVANESKFLKKREDRACLKPSTPYRSTRPLTRRTAPAPSVRSLPSWRTPSWI